MPKQTNHHQGRLAVVTGAAEGIGQAYAVQLAEEGADIAVIDKLDASQTQEAVEKTGRRAHVYRCDLADSDAVLTTSNEILRTLGGCDILVNNAGVGWATPFDDIDLSRFRRTLGINLESPFLLCKAFVPFMRERGWGRIVNISAGMLNATVPNYVDYIVSKSGLVGLTRALATEVGGNGVTVNAIAPGLVRTPLTERGREGPALREEHWEMVRQMQPIPRIMMPSDLVGALSFLVSDGAAFMTGQVLHIDGGVVRV